MTVAQKSPVTLIIAEKPSVAADLVKALGAKKFKKEKTAIAFAITVFGPSVEIRTQGLLNPIH